MPVTSIGRGHTNRAAVALPLLDLAVPAPAPSLRGAAPPCSAQQLSEPESEKLSPPLRRKFQS
jgi:hypothetical protein